MLHMRVSNALCIVLLLTIACVAQVPSRTTAEVTRERVLDLLFSKDVTSRPYYARFVLRLSDPDSQLVLILYPGGSAEMVKYSLEPRDGGTNLIRVISEELRKNPRASDRELAAKFHVNVKRSNADEKALKDALDELKKMKISPYLDTVIVTDERSIFDYWFDSGGESVHYSLFRTYRQTSSDELVQWMIRFKNTLK